jgi:hypothetical protein
MGAKRTAKKAAAPKKKAAAPKKAPAKKAAQARRSALSPDELVARIAATGLVPTAYVLPWESIHGPGDYAAIARAVRDLAGADFPLEKVSDSVDLAGEQASLELSLDGVHHVLEAEVDGPHVDDGVLVMLAALFDRRQSGQPLATRRGLFVDPTTCEAAKTYLLLCATDEAKRVVNAAAGAGFIPVTEL